MRFEIGRHGIRVIPEDEHDIAYIEDTLGLKHEGDYVDLTRIDIVGLRGVAYLETGRRARDAELARAIFNTEQSELFKREIGTPR